MVCVRLVRKSNLVNVNLNLKTSGKCSEVFWCIYVIKWWSAGDSNSSPRQCECRALPDELAPHVENYITEEVKNQFKWPRRCEFYRVGKDVKQRGQLYDNKEWFRDRYENPMRMNLHDYLQKQKVLLPGL